MKGFTLFELLTITLIIGILAAIAIPSFSHYRTNSYNIVAINDLRNLINMEEAYFTDHSKYSPYQCNDSSVGEGNYLKFICSKGVQIEAWVGSTLDFWTAHSRHTYGNKTYFYDSRIGNIHE